MKGKISAISAAIAAALSLHLALAQSPSPTASPAPDQGAQDGGRRGNYEQFRQRMNERLKENLKVSDEEWAVIQPLIEKVQVKQREAGASRFGGGRPRGGPDGGSPGQGSGNRPERAGSEQAQALRTALDDANSTPEDLKAKLAALRESRKKAQAELEQTREELRKVLTLRQEASLVLIGILE